jgi:hypothetical protein
MRTSHVFFVVLSLMIAATVTVPGQTGNVPVYAVSRTATPIKVDGNLDDAVWTRAEPFPNLRLNIDGSPAPYQTEVRALYDDTFLYFSFRSRDDNIWATLKTRDQHLWDEEVIEVFLQADPYQRNYIELEVNPLGTMLDIYLLDIRKPLHYESWNSQKIKWAVQVSGTVDGKSGDREWTCEIAVPLEDVVTAKNLPPKTGDRWRMNLYRVEQLPKPALLAWSPTYKDDFHLPEKFGELVFTNRVVR